MDRDGARQLWRNGFANCIGTAPAALFSADSTSWSKSSSGTPLNLWVQTRTFWDTSGNVLYAYLRQLSLDARGC